MATRLAVNKFGNTDIGAGPGDQFPWFRSANFGPSVSCERTTAPIPTQFRPRGREIISNLYLSSCFFQGDDAHLRALSVRERGRRPLRVGVINLHSAGTTGRHIEEAGTPVHTVLVGNWEAHPPRKSIPMQGKVRKFSASKEPVDSVLSWGFHWMKIF